VVAGAVAAHGPSGATRCSRATRSRQNDTETWRENKAAICILVISGGLLRADLRLRLAKLCPGAGGGLRDSKRNLALVPEVPNAGDYRAEYGLNRQTALAPPALRATRAATLRRQGLHKRGLTQAERAQGWTNKANKTRRQEDLLNRQKGVEYTFTCIMCGRETTILQRGRQLLLLNILNEPVEPSPVHLDFDIAVCKALGVSVTQGELSEVYGTIVKEMIVTRGLRRD